MVNQMLKNVRVVDLSFWLPGPFCSQILADLGAEVIKVERRLMGDPLRIALNRGETEGNLFLAMNRNKKSIALNLKKESGCEIATRLATTADVLLEGFPPGQMQKLGLGYERLKALNPRLIYCSLSGYGQEGEYARRPGHDVTYAALSGLLDLWIPDGPPTLPGVQLADLSGALFATIGILGALFQRESTGQGDLLDVCLFDSVVGLTGYTAEMRAKEESQGMLTGGLAGYHLYATRDGRWMALGALEPVFWADFCRAVGRKDLVGKALPAPEHRASIISEIEEIFAAKTQEEWVEIFRDKGVCCEPVLTVNDALERSHLKDRGMVYYLEHPTAGPTRQIDLPIRSRSSISNDSPREKKRKKATPAPALGQHTGELLQELGYSNDEIAELYRLKAVNGPGLGPS